MTKVVYLGGNRAKRSRIRVNKVSYLAVPFQARRSFLSPWNVYLDRTLFHIERKDHD